MAFATGKAALVQQTMANNENVATHSCHGYGYRCHAWPSLALDAALKEFIKPAENVYKHQMDTDRARIHLQQDINTISKTMSRQVTGKNSNSLLLPGYHLLYFNSVTQQSELLEDGTDILHAPDSSWKYRLWMGGTMKFMHPVRYGSTPAIRKALVERISNVKVRGSKVLVEIERVVLPADIDGGDWSYATWKSVDLQPETSASAPVPAPANARPQPESRDKPVGQTQAEGRARRLRWQAFPDIYPRSKPAHPAVKHLIRETRWLCFTREKPNLSPPRRIPLPEDAEIAYRATFTPTPALLFRFSALTYNAHAIHLDPAWTQTHYGLRERLVHGPLTAILMLRIAYRALFAAAANSPMIWTITSIDYKNHAPLYVNEQLNVACARVERAEDGPDGKASKKGSMRVWILRRHEDGGGQTVCVSGKLGLVEADKEEVYELKRMREGTDVGTNPEARANVKAMIRRQRKKQTMKKQREDGEKKLHEQVAESS